MSTEQAVQAPAAPRGADGGRIRALMDAGQEMSMAAVALNAAGATITGMNPTDLFCLWHVTQTSASEPVTAGRLADLTGLTTGAITGVINRLEESGLVRRERDPHDRRKVLIQPVAERVAEIYRLYGPLEEMFRELGSRYSAEEQELIIEFLRRTTAMMRQNVVAIRESRGKAPNPAR